MATFDELLQATDEVLTHGARLGAMHNVAEDARLDGRTVTVHGRRLLNFGSCSYLGLETHPALKAAVADAVERFGTQFSSSRAYLSSPAYAQAEQVLSELFGRPAMITTSTSLTHVATLPTLLGSGDALILDHQVHNSVQTAATIAQAHGSTVTLIPHNDMATLERRVAELARTHRRVWYAADGLYSMYADYAPIGALNELASRYEQLWFYIDDAHAVSWSGRHGRGYFIDTAVYPGVPAKRCGARIALTAHHTHADVADLVEAVADVLPRALADEGSDVRTLQRAFARQLEGRPVRLRSSMSTVEPQPSLRLERHDSISTVDTAEWDTMFAGRGAFMSTGLRAIEAAFAGSGEPKNAWRFHYWIVRSPDGEVAAATFATTNLWKDDMLSPADVSAEVERERRADPYRLTSTMVATGCLVTEGNHLYLDRTGDWRGALRLILAAAREEEDRVGGAAVVLRDPPDGDDDLREFLSAEGFLRIPIRTTWVRTMDFDGDDAFLAALPKKARYHQRTKVLAWEPRYRVTVVAGGSSAARALTAADRAALYRLYRNVHARSLELNVFPLPARFFDAMLAQPGWELVILRLPEVGDQPVAFAALHVGAEHVQPVLVGLDYRYVASHHAYQQTLWQTIRSAQRHGADRVLFGMSADLQKARFGSRPQVRWVFVQPTESYQNDVLLQLAERVSTA